MVCRDVIYAPSHQRGFYGLYNAPVAASDPQWQTQASVVSAYLSQKTGSKNRISSSQKIKSSRLRNNREVPLVNTALWQSRQSTPGPIEVLRRLTASQTISFNTAENEAAGKCLVYTVCAFYHTKEYRTV